MKVVPLCKNGGKRESCTYQLKSFDNWGRSVLTRSVFEYLNLGNQQSKLL